MRSTVSEPPASWRVGLPILSRNIPLSITQQGGLQGLGRVSRLSDGPVAVLGQASQLRLCFRQHGIHAPQSQVRLLVRPGAGIGKNYVMILTSSQGPKEGCLLMVSSPGTAVVQSWLESWGVPPGPAD